MARLGVLAKEFSKNQTKKLSFLQLSLLLSTTANTVNIHMVLVCSDEAGPSTARYSLK